jgi:protein-L-isoaspartate(D-aspartate) O-methyltransferase
VGVGCGYQTALLAEMGCEVVGLERIGALADAARRRLAAYGKVRVRHVDGLTGAQPEAPFAGILVCAECEEIPTALVGQLQEEGRLVLPLRRRGSVRLTAVGSDGKILSRRDPVAFVPIREGVA